ncbi:MAG: hypothetical protein R2779_11895 [Crocinitomicaceae bacterium]
MKRLFYFAVATAMVATTAVSCGKSTKGKMDGEWTISSWESIVTEIDGNDTETSTTKINATSYSESYTSGSTTTTETGTVNQATWNIKKDGTWDKVVDFTYVSGSTTYKYTITSSGKWDFLKGVSKDYKNNERVVFNTLNSKSTRVTTVGGSSYTNSSSDTYKDGEVSTVYLITESKGKSLKLSADGSNDYSYTSGSTTNTSTTNTKETYSLQQ